MGLPSGGASSGASSSLQTNSVLDEDLQAAMNLKKRKRMQSNRDSARRSRMRKQKYLDDLMEETERLKKENGQLRIIVSFYMQNLQAVEAENSVLRTQAIELSSSLNSLNEILLYMYLNSSSSSSVNPFLYEF